MANSLDSDTHARAKRDLLSFARHVAPYKKVEIEILMLKKSNQKILFFRRENLFWKIIREIFFKHLKKAIFSKENIYFFLWKKIKGKNNFSKEKIFSFEKIRKFSKFCQKIYFLPKNQKWSYRKKSPIFFWSKNLSRSWLEVYRKNSGASESASKGMNSCPMFFRNESCRDQVGTYLELVRCYHDFAKT